MILLFYNYIFSFNHSFIFQSFQQRRRRLHTSRRNQASIHDSIEQFLPVLLKLVFQICSDASSKQNNLQGETNCLVFNTAVIQGNRRDDHHSRQESRWQDQLLRVQGEEKIQLMNFITSRLNKEIKKIASAA